MSVAHTTGRAERLVSLLEDAQLDAILISDLTNVRYLTGFTGSSGVVLIGAQMRVFVTDFRYVEQAAEEVDRSFDRRRAPRELNEIIGELLPPISLRLGFEEAHLTVRQWGELREALPDRVELVGVEGLVERLRAVKEPDEVSRIAEATRLADSAFEELAAEKLIGRTERELAFALEQKMRERGASAPSFETIVAAGPHGSLPHATPRETEIEPGQLVVIDWGATLDGYCSDCTRTLAAGEPGATEREIYQLVLEAELNGVRAAIAGAPARDVDNAAREVIVAGGHGEQFGHGLGHGVGLAVHERPRVSRRSDAVLAPGNVITVEPGIYLPGEFGVRIEDLVAIGEDGHEILTSVPKELTITD